MPAIRSHKGALIAGIVCLAVVGAVALCMFWRDPSSSLPAGLKKQINFATYFPDTSWTVATEDASYQNGVLRFTSRQATRRLTFTEQATPQVFSEIPQYFPTLLTKMNQYASFTSAVGTVYLTKPTELKGGQTAVLEARGSLLFIRPNQEFTDRQWQQLFDSLRLFK